MGGNGSGGNDWFCSSPTCQVDQMFYTTVLHGGFTTVNFLAPRFYNSAQYPAYTLRIFSKQNILLIVSVADPGRFRTTSVASSPSCSAPSTSILYPVLRYTTPTRSGSASKNWARSSPGQSQRFPCHRDAGTARASSWQEARHFSTVAQFWTFLRNCPGTAVVERRRLLFGLHIAADVLNTYMRRR